MNDIVQTTPDTVAVHEPTTLLQVIQQAAVNPDVDIEKMERLMAMHERVIARDAEVQFNIAMTAAQRQIRPVAPNKRNSQTQSDYASYEAIDKAIRPIYIEHGFSLSFDTEPSEPDTIRVVCYVSHEAGHSRTYGITMPADGKGAKGGDVMTKTHATGCGMSYGQRYLIKAIFNISIGRDDDGNSATYPTITESQVADLEALISEVGADKQKYLAFSKINSLDEILAVNYPTAVATLEAKRKA